MIWASKIILLILCCFATQAFSRNIYMTLGPGGLGNGGTNPLSIPPELIDIEIGYVDQSNYVYSFSLIPGIFMGKKFTKGVFFGELGGGLTIAPPDIGIGVYSSLGFESAISKKLAFMGEVKQALGLSSYVYSSYAVRLGISYIF